MKRKAISYALVALAVTFGLVALAVQPAAKAPEPIKVAVPDFTKLSLCTVDAVSDGESVRLRSADQRLLAPIRLLGVDATGGTPEAAAQAKTYLSNLLAGEQVWLQEAENAASEKGKALATLYRYPDGLNVNLELVRNGYAAVAVSSALKERDTFTLFQTRASAAAKGRFAVPPPKAAKPEDKPAAPAVTVYGTKTGTKYHTAGCSYLSKSSISMTLEQAKAKGLSPCSRCHPPS